MASSPEQADVHGTSLEEKRGLCLYAVCRPGWYTAYKVQYGHIKSFPAGHFSAGYTGATQTSLPGILLSARLREITTSICYPLLDGFNLGILPVWFAFFFLTLMCVYVISIEAILE